jgi:hypothetical protein
MPDRVLVHRVGGQARILADLRQQPVEDGSRTSLFPSLIGREEPIADTSTCSLPCGSSYLLYTLQR